jgi:hypothetical protein
MRFSAAMCAIGGLVISTLAGCAPSYRTRTAGDRVCISWSSVHRRCRAWEAKWPEDAQTPADKIEEDADREAARRAGHPYFPPQYKYESASAYLERVDEEARRAEAKEKGGWFLARQRDGESFEHYSKRFFEGVESSRPSQSGSGRPSLGGSHD